MSSAEPGVPAATRGVARWIAVVLITLGAACGGDGVSVSGPSTTTGASAATPAAVTTVSGGGQSAAPGAMLASPLVVRVTTAAGAAVAGATVTFRVSSGTGTVSTASAATDATGQASTQLTLGGTAGTVEVTATVQGTTLSTTFSAVVSGPVTSLSCTAAGATSLTPGQATTPTANGVCLTGGTGGAEYALVAFNGALDGRSSSALAVLPSGTDPVTTTLTSRAPLASRAATPFASALPLRSGYEAALHARRARELRALIPAARAWQAGRSGAASGMRRSVIPANVTVGQLVRLNANGNDPCTNADFRAARVQAVSSKAIVVADTANPAGGFTSADFQSIAATFDTLIDAVDTRNFGQPTDIDNNGHVVLFFTSAVNALTPRNSGEYVGGFFDSRDLFPTASSNGLPGCAGSNVGELFYLLVPDPSGMVNGNRFSKTFVNTVTLSTVAHEYEHLINSSRRLFITDASDFEEPWLDEGLAHVAEELYFYARSRLGPRQNIDIVALKRSTATTAAFNDGGVANFDRLELYLDNPSRNSPYADNDSLATRGAAWSFLRYAADQQTAAQETVWSRLVNSPTTGIANLQQVFGADIASRFRDWATALLLDDVAGSDARYQMPSWNYRAIYGALSSNGVYPLSTVALTSGTTRTVDIMSGGAAYLRFGIGAGKTAGVSWATLPSTLQLTLVRLR